MSRREKTLLATLLIILPLFQIPIAHNQEKYPLTVQDDFNRSVTIQNRPTRIISLAPSNTEILFALKLESSVVGVTEQCDHPPRVLDLKASGAVEVIGGYATPSLEKIVALNPDLVLAATSLQTDVIHQLEAQGLTVVGLNPKTVSETLHDITLVGLICDVEAEALKLTQQLTSRINYITSRVSAQGAPPKVYYELWYDPLMSVGKGSWIDELIHMAGGENIFSNSENPYPIVNPEAVLELNPDVIIIPIGYMGGEFKPSLEGRPGWNALSAVKNGRIYEVDEDLLLRPGPRIVEGLWQIAVNLYPERFTGNIAFSEGATLNTNSTVKHIIYDEGRLLLNVTVQGPDGTKGHASITMRKELISGEPVALIDGSPAPFTLQSNQTHHIIEVYYVHSEHQITFGGSDTIPEISLSTTFLLLAVLLLTCLALIAVSREASPRPLSRFSSSRSPSSSSRWSP
ncbi:MAG: cobalamin-binding protein [Candidatus Bathyarchaeia archaeon]